MRKIIFVNATAATEGGILTILNQFIDEIKNNNIKKFKYYIFTSIEIENDNENIVIINNIKGKQKLDRLKWDMFGMKKWSYKNRIKPNLIISLQNTGVRFNKIKQIVYIHQSLPYAQESKWRFTQKDERKFWFYKNLYKLWIDFTVKNNAYVVVQAEWMKKALIEKKYDKDKIIISKPNMKYIEIEDIKEEKRKYKYLFYPAADYKYKNHIILIEAIKRLNEQKDKLEKFKIIFTLDKSSHVYLKVKEANIEDYFDFVGNMKYEEVLSYYKGCQGIVFPSYIETIGLPLIEAQYFGKRILVSNCKYSREVLEKYENAKFIRYDDIELWMKNISTTLQEYIEKPCIVKSKNGWNTMFDLIDNILVFS